MEPYTHCLMWMKRKNDFNSKIINNSSWEEQAFAEDTAGPLGGFVWPPRSYCCSFCKREFRSAQALGGHMNVHRRDRARLKQSLGSATEALHGQSMAAQNQSHIGNTKQGRPSYVSSSSSISSGSRVSAIFSQERSGDHANYISHAFASAKECSKRFLSSFSLSPPSFDSNDVRVLGIANSSNATIEKNRKKEESMVVNHDETIKRKRHKTTAVSSLPLLHKPCSSDRYRMQEDAVLRVKLNSTEDIDLELRLGHPQAVK